MTGLKKGKTVSAAKKIKEIKRNTRPRYNAEEKIRIVLEGLRGEDRDRHPRAEEGLRKEEEGRPRGEGPRIQEAQVEIEEEKEITFFTP